MSNIDRMEYWGINQISQHTGRGKDRVYQMIRERDFPLPSLILSEKQKAWTPSSVRKYWAAKQKPRPARKQATTENESNDTRTASARSGQICL